MSPPMTAAERRAFNEGLQAAVLAISIKKLKSPLCAPQQAMMYVWGA
jgi:hypothetical protein